MYEEFVLHPHLASLLCGWNLNGTQTFILPDRLYLKNWPQLPMLCLMVLEVPHSARSLLCWVNC